MNYSFTKQINRDTYTLEAIVVKTGDGISVYLGGGDKSHVGTVVVSQPRLSLSGDDSRSCTTSVFNLLHHKDDGVAVPLAEFLCKELNQVVVVTAGVHIDNATAEQINSILADIRDLGQIIKQNLVQE